MSSGLFLIQEGILALSKNLDHLKGLKADLKPPFKFDFHPTLLNLGRGDLLGEDSFFYSRPSTYTLTVISASATLLSLSKEHLLAGYPKLARSPSLKNFFLSR
jgi:CRP-like cAMP-binding protein